MRNLTPTAPALRIVLVDGHAILRDGLKVLIEREPGYHVAGQFSCMRDSLEGICALQPHVVLIETALSGRSGIELLGEVRRLSPLTRKLVLTAHGEEQHVRAALNAGADGYILKHADGAELIQAIRTVAAGQQFLCKAVAQKILSGYLSGDKRPECAPEQLITVREREVLTRVALGNSNKLIARDLGLSPKTIEKHRANFMRKLRLRSVAAITTYAIRHGMTGETFGGRAGALGAFAQPIT